MRRQDGAYRWHLLRARALVSELPVRWFVTLTEVEEQHRFRQLHVAQYQELAQVHHSREAVTYATNHDLRQPALNLRSLFEELRQAHVLRQLDHTLHELDASFHELNHSVQLPLPEPEEDIAFPQLLEEVLLGLRGLVVQGAAQVEVAVTPDFWLRGRRASLLAICYNLLNNALQFAHPGRPARVVVCGCRLAGGARGAG